MAQLDSLFAAYDKLFLFDTETTGLSYARDEIIEFAAVTLSGKAAGSWSQKNMTS